MPGAAVLFFLVQQEKTHAPAAKPVHSSNRLAICVACILLAARRAAGNAAGDRITHGDTATNNGVRHTTQQYGSSEHLQEHRKQTAHLYCCCTSEHQIWIISTTRNLSCYKDTTTPSLSRQRRDPRGIDVVSYLN